jgi:hypothetical protein
MSEQAPSKEYLPRVDRLTVARVIDGSGTQSERSAVWNYICGLERTLAERTTHEPPADLNNLIDDLTKAAREVEAHRGAWETERLDKARAALRAAYSPQPPAPEWQSIETAPKDGKTILICGGTFDSDDESYGDMPFPGVSLVYWDSMRLSAHWHGESRDGHDSWFVHKPTHWMPVPAPYSTATKPAVLTRICDVCSTVHSGPPCPTSGERDE